MKMKELNVVFMGTPKFSVPILQALIDNCNVVGVVTQPDKEVGRHKDIEFSEVKKKALEYNIPVVQPVKIRKEFDCVLEMNPDIIVTCAYGQIIPKEILDYPKYKCINVHASLLPKYRGGAPIHHAIMNGDEETGITIMYMAEGMDDGDIIKEEKVKIEENDNTETLENKLSKLGSDILIRTLPSILDNTNERIKQDESQVTFAKIIKKEDEVLDFNDSAVNIHNKIRALSPQPGAYSLLDGKRMKMLKSEVIKNNSEKNPGTILAVEKDYFVVKANPDAVKIGEIQPEGKKKMTVKEYLNGVKKEVLLDKQFKKE